MPPGFRAKVGGRADRLFGGGGVPGEAERAQVLAGRLIFAIGCPAAERGLVARLAIAVPLGPVAPESVVVGGSGFLTIGFLRGGVSALGVGLILFDPGRVDRIGEGSAGASFRRVGQVRDLAFDGGPAGRR